MEYTTIANITQPVSRIGLGTWAIGGWMWGGSDEEESIATILHALDNGINLIDTAPVYGFGVSEEIVGKALKQYGKRDRVIVATKCGLSWDSPQKVYRDSRKATIEKEIEASLKRLQIDYIDLYQVHWPDPLNPIEETAETLQTLLTQGKIRAIGVSNHSIEQIQTFQQTASVHACQPPFNLFERDVEKKELAYCIKQQIATLGYGSLCRGLLTGKIQKNTVFKGDYLRKSDPKFQEPLFSQYLHAVEQLDAWVKQTYQRSVLSLAIRWALDNGISVALWGARKPDQVKPVGSMWDWKLTPDDMKTIDRIITTSVTTPLGASFMAPPSRNTT